MAAFDFAGVRAALEARVIVDHRDGRIVRQLGVITLTVLDRALSG